MISNYSEQITLSDPTHIDIAQDGVQKPKKPTMSVIAQKPTKSTCEAQLELNGPGENL